MSPYSALPMPAPKRSSLPEARTGMAPWAQAYSTPAVSSLPKVAATTNTAPPRLRLTTLAPWSTTQLTPASTSTALAVPPLKTLATTISASGATPATPAVVLEGGGDAGHVGAVAEVVLGRAGALERVAPGVDTAGRLHDVGGEVLVGEVDAGVDDADPDPVPVVLVQAAGAPTGLMPHCFSKDGSSVASAGGENPASQGQPGEDGNDTTPAGRHHHGPLDWSSSAVDVGTPARRLGQSPSLATNVPDCRRRSSCRKGRGSSGNLHMVVAAENVSYLAALGGGVVSFLSPCVLPIVPAYLSVITGLDVAEVKEGDRKHLPRIALHTRLFIAGFTAGVRAPRPGGHDPGPVAPATRRRSPGGRGC